ncbi:MAG TPA: hypothetical protein PKA41_07925 [Verrucomicrobiota bacterium]|nr:hypothetical protein [Verrucomicrobiota bacterium]
MNSNDQLIQCKAFSSEIPVSGDTPPDDIQFMPPGRHYIETDSGFKGHVQVNARAAEMLDRLLQERRNAAATAGEDYPFFDFNHDDGEASGRPVKIYWGGDDRKTGGIRARAQWSENGVKALTGKPVPAFRRFSPSFYTNAAGEVTGAPINMGGLVNKAAFKTITPIVAGGPGDTRNQKRMDADTTKLAADLAAANARITELTKQLSDKESTAAVQAKDSEIKTLKDKIVDLEKERTEAIKVEAKAAVADAAAAGKLPPQDKETLAHYESLYIANPTATKAVLAKLTPNPALATVTGAATGAAGSASATTGEHEFVVKAKAFGEQHKIADELDAQAKFAGTKDGRELYEKYRAQWKPETAKS